jgi:hypothetical protein
MLPANQAMITELLYDRISLSVRYVHALVAFYKKLSGRFCMDSRTWSFKKSKFDEIVEELTKFGFLITFVAYTPEIDYHTSDQDECFEISTGFNSEFVTLLHEIEGYQYNRDFCRSVIPLKSKEMFAKKLFEKYDFPVQETIKKIDNVTTFQYTVEKSFDADDELDFDLEKENIDPKRMKIEKRFSNMPCSSSQIVNNNNKKPIRSVGKLQRVV